MVAWLRIDLGREYQDSRGRSYRKFRGVYGRCWYATKQSPTIRISCQVPGPFPCEIVTRKKPVYRKPDGSWPEGFKSGRKTRLFDSASGRCRIRQYGKTVVNDLAEASVWIVAHEAFHWLRMTRQISARNTEIEADAFADKMLDEFRHSPCTSADQDQHGQQLTFWEMDAAAPSAY